MRKVKRSRRSAASIRTAQETRKGWLKLVVVAALVATVGGAYVAVARGNKALDEETLCPATPSSITVLLVDVTDPMTTAQRQDFRNQLSQLKNSIPRYGKLVVTKVDSSSSALLQPVIVRCNPGIAKDVDEWNGDPQGVQNLHDKGFSAPLDAAFARLTNASAADRSPIFESVQSVRCCQVN